MNLFIPIAKVDEQRREVWGVAAEEAPDKSGEIMDYTLSRPRFEEWSKSISDATDGKSLGNVRAMHQPIAAGKLVDMQFDDTAKKVYVGAKIVDDTEWKKVVEGVYTGFSVGGRYGAQKYENGLLRYEAIPSEVSIVDNPCMRGATFTMVKADGVSEQRPFISAEMPDLAKLAGDLETLSKAGARHSASDQHLVQAIHDSACSLGAGCGMAEKTAEKADGGALKKNADDEPAWVAWSAGMDVSDLATALSFVSGLAGQFAGGNADLAGKLAAAAQLITSALNDKVAEQAAAAQAAAIDAAQDESLEAKVEAATGNAATPVATSDVTSATTPATPAADNPQGAAGEDMNKSLDAFKVELINDVKALLKEFTEGAAAPLQKAEKSGNDLAKRFDEVTARLGAFEGRIDKLEKMPPGSGPILREVGGAPANDGDALIASLDKLINEERDPAVRQSLMARRAQEAIKLQYRAGGTRLS